TREQPPASSAEPCNRGRTETRPPPPCHKQDRPPPPESKTATQATWAQASSSAPLILLAVRRPNASKLVLVVGRRNDQHRPPGMLCDLVRDAPLEDLLRAAQPSGSDHDHRSVQLVGEIDDSLPGGPGEGGSHLGGETRGAGELCAPPGHLVGLRFVQVFER